MLGVIWYFSTWYIAYCWIARTAVFRRFFSFGEALTAAIIVGTIGGSWLVYLCACLSTVLSESTILAATLIGYCFVWFRAPADVPKVPRSLPCPPSAAVLEKQRGSTPTAKQPPYTPLPLTGDDGIALALVIFISLWLLPIYSHRMIPTDEHGNIVTGGSCYGDLPIHMTIANSFLVGVNMEIKWGKMISPIFAGEHMTYPFLPDFHAAIMVQLGESMRTGFFLPGFSMACALWALLYYLAIRMTKSRLGACLSAFLTIFAGGMGGWRWAQEHGWDVAFQRDVIQHDPSGEWKFLWFAFIPHIMLPQRGGNFAYPMAVLSILLVWKACDACMKMEPHHRGSLLLHAAIFAASLPMVQAHSFIGVGVIIGVVFVLDAHKWLQDRRLLTSWGIAGVTALLLAMPQMTQFTKTVQAGFYGKFMTYGWLFHNYEFGQPYGVIGFFNFWWNSVGPALYLFVAGTVLYGLEAIQAWRMGRRLVKDHGSGAIAHYLQSIANGDAMYGAKQENVEDPYDCDTLFSIRRVLQWLDSTIVNPLVQNLGFASLYTRWRLDEWDSKLSPLNALSCSGRALDTIKFAIGAFGVFLLGNYINLQPWDRDNAKIFYIWVFVASSINGPLLCAPLESLFGLQPGTRRLTEWLTGIMPCWLAVPENRGNRRDAKLQTVLPVARKAISLGLALAAAALAFFCMLSGYILLSQEFQPNGVMLDRSAQDMGEYIKANVSPKAVIMHSNYHVQPSGAIGARPSLVSYYGWVSNHGYNSHERLGDRDYVMDNALKDSDEHAYFLCRKWGVRYIVGENIRRHARPSEASPDFDANLFLDGKLKRTYVAGRYELFEVLGY